MIRIPDHMRDPERYLWGGVVLALILMISTDPWFREVWHWWAFGAVCVAAGATISYWAGYRKGLKIGSSRGYTECYKLLKGKR